MARRTTRTTVMRVIVATMIEQRDGEVDAPASRKNLSVFGCFKAFQDFSKCIVNVLIIAVITAINHHGHLQ